MSMTRVCETTSTMTKSPTLFQHLSELALRYRAQTPIPEQCHLQIYSQRRDTFQLQPFRQPARECFCQSCAARAQSKNHRVISDHLVLLHWYVVTTGLLALHYSYYYLNKRSSKACVISKMQTVIPIDLICTQSVYIKSMVIPNTTYNL